MEAPAASRRRRRFTCDTWLFSSKPSRAYASLYVAPKVLRANVFPVVVLPSAANPPARTSVFSTTRPALLVHAERFPDSNPSANTGVAPAGVVTDEAVLAAETLLEA